jgi:hypothetical protein
MTVAMVRRSRYAPAAGELRVDQFARVTGLHPDLVSRFIALGLLDATQDPATGDLRLPRSQVAAAARLQRLRAGFALNYAALGLVADLLDRIAELERAARAPKRKATPWT